MRRKSERVKDKTVEKKPEKSPKKSRTRSSRRRKKSSSTSPESSEAEDYDSVHNSHDEMEEDLPSSGRSRREKTKVAYAEGDADENAVDTVSDEKGSNSRTRRSSKKQTAEEAAEQVKPDLAEDKTSIESEVKADSSDPKHKEKEGKSSLWQVKSAESSSGEIKKLKLCIVRPPEPELSPRKRKKLNRSSHHDQADGESEENSARDSSGERRKGRRSLRNASASDDSVSPEKHKSHRSSRGKHKPGDSSEDGQRTQDSCEETAGVVEMAPDRQASPVGDVSISAVEDTDGHSDVHETEERPHSAAEEEESVASTNSPISQLETPVDPFDQLKAEGTKARIADSAPIVTDDKPVLDTLVVICDSTEESRLERRQKVEESSVTVNVPVVLDLNVDKSEVCDSSVDVQKSTPVVNLPEKTPVAPVHLEQERKSRDSSEERPIVEELIKEIPKESVTYLEKPSEDSLEGRHKVRDASKNVSDSRDSSEETHTVKDTSRKRRSSRDKSEERRVRGSSRKDGRSRDKSEERRTARESSRKDRKSQDLSAERLAAKETLHTSEEKANVPAPEKTQVEDKVSSIEHKHRSRRLNRTSAGDRHRHVSPHKADIEAEASKGKEAKEVSTKKSKVEIDISTESKDDISTARKKGAERDASPKKSKGERDISPKKSKEEKVDSTDSKPRKEPSQRTRIVWDEKPAVESRRPKEAAAPSDRSRDLSTKSSPPKNEEVKEVAVHVHVPTVKVSSVEVAKPLPLKRREKITLKRSFSSKTKTDAAESQENGESADKEPQPSDKEEAGAARKRRWGGSKVSGTGAKPVLSISSDSLKSLIPEARPLEISEVELAPEEEEEEEKEEGEVENNEDAVTSEVEMEDERDEEKGALGEPEPVREREVKLVFPTGASANVPLPEEHRDRGTSARKISIVTDDTRALARSPSPARHRASNILYITNLVRPFTVNQLRELLARTGTIADNGFWIDNIKSKCYVKYATEREALETRHALHGVRWPVSNPKQLCVDYGALEDMELAQTLLDGGGQIPRKTQPIKVDSWLTDLDREKERARLARERVNIERERAVDRDANRERKMAGGIREWDLGKVEGGAFDDGRVIREERGGEKERRMRKDRDYRSPSPRDAPARKIKKKEDEAPTAKLLDDLFRKTKTTPCVYWLPLTADQIVVKEEMRRKHMAEHERRMEEMRKAEKERLSRMQGRPPQRRYNDNNRRRRSHSASPRK